MLLVNQTCKYGCLQSVILSAFHTVFPHQSKSTQPENHLAATGELGYNYYVTKQRVIQIQGSKVTAKSVMRIK